MLFALFIFLFWFGLVFRGLQKEITFCVLMHEICSSTGFGWAGRSLPTSGMGGRIRRVKMWKLVCLISKAKAARASKSKWEIHPLLPIYRQVFITPCKLLWRNLSPSKTSTVPVLTELFWPLVLVLKEASCGPYRTYPNPGTRNLMFAQPCASDASSLIPASQLWCVSFLALICLGALAAGDGE